MIIKRWEHHRNLVLDVVFAVTKIKPEKSLPVQDSNTAQGSIPPYKPDFFPGLLFATAKVASTTAMIFSSLRLILHPAVLIYDYHISIILPVIMFGRISTSNTKQTRLIIQQQINWTIVVAENSISQGHPTTVSSQIHRKHFLGYPEYF